MRNYFLLSVNFLISQKIFNYFYLQLYLSGLQVYLNIICRKQFVNLK